MRKLVLQHRFWLIVLFIMVLPACAPIAWPEQAGGDQRVVLADGPVGQTFLAQYDGLMGVEVRIRAQTDGVLRYHLQARPEDDAALAGGEITLEPNTSPILIRFPFEIQQDSAKNSYFFTVEAAQPGEFVLRGAPGTSYLHGAAYQDGEPLPDLQLAFRLVYHPGWMLWGLIREAGGWLGRVVLFAAAYLLPGWIGLKLLWPGWEGRAGLEKIVLATVAGLGVYPLWLVWTDVVGVPLGAGNVWGPVVLAGGYLLWQGWRMGGWHPARHLRWLRDMLHVEVSGFVVLVGLVFAVRFWVVRLLDVPMWGDAFQHTMMAQLLVDHGGLFTSWAPYAPMTTFTYHFGFHTHAAVLHWLTGMPVAEAVLWGGQIVNGLAVVSLYPVAKRVGGTHWAGLAAVLVAGLLTSMPMFYVNWGRYTQLTGQALLPLILLVVWEAFETGGRSWRVRGLIGVLMAGLALTHYRALIFAVLWLPVVWLVRVRREDTRQAFWLTFWAGGIGGVLFLPWFVNVFGGRILAIFAKQVGTPVSALSETTIQYNAVGDVLVYLPGWVWALVPVCVGWGLWRRNRLVLALAVWWGVLLLAANPAWLGLPGSGALSNFAVFIAAYLPAGVLLGGGVGWVEERLRGVRGMRWGWPVGVSVLGVVLALWGARMRIGEVNPARFALVTRPDMQAAAWIEENLPEDAHFLVNGFLTSGDISVVGADAGWWLPLLAHRSVTVPPLTYMMEQNPEADFRARVKVLPGEIRAKGLENPEVLGLLLAEGVTHVFIGQLQGRVNSPGPFFDPLIMQENAHFRVVYHEDRVWIFEVVP